MKRSTLIFTAVIIFFTQNAFSQKTFSGFGLSVGTNILVGETQLTDSQKSPNFGFHGLFDFTEKISLKFQAGYGRFGIDNKNLTLTTSFIPVEIIGMISPFGKSTVSPFLHFGLGAISFSKNNSRNYDGLFIGGGGLSAQLSDKFSCLISTDLRYTTSDQFNGITNGLYDGYLNFQIGLTYNLNRQKLFERKPSVKRETIIAAKTISDPVLDIVEMQSKIDYLKRDISVKDEQLRQIISQIQTRQDRINKIESEIAILTKGRREGYKQIINQEVTPKNISETTQLTNAQIRIKYEQAQSLIRSKQFDRAIFELKMLSQNNNTHPLHSNFIYWIGECYFAEGKYSDAINYFKKVNNFKRSHKLDDALIMSGICLMKLGNFQDAKQKFRELIQEFPDSEYLVKATKYLQALERQIIS